MVMYSMVFVLKPLLVHLLGEIPVPNSALQDLPDMLLVPFELHFVEVAYPLAVGPITNLEEMSFDFAVEVVHFDTHELHNLSKNTK